jgi:Rieske Fe-S protein
VARLDARLVDAGTVAVTVNSTMTFVPVGTAALAEATTAGIVRFLLIARVSDTEFSVLDGVCTHQGCTVSLFGSPVFECPCHGSRYAIDGTVVRGPAAAALPRLASELRGEDLVVTL